MFDFFNIPYIVMEVNPQTKKELINFPSEMRHVPLVRIDDTKKRVEAQARAAAALTKVLPKELRNRIGADADLSKVVEQVKFLSAKFAPEKKAELSKKLDMYLKELDPEYGVTYFGRDNLGGLVDWLRAKNAFSGRRFISEQALDMTQWINKKYRPMVFLNTCKSFSRSCELFSYQHRIPQYPRYKQELLHHWGSIYLRWVIKYRLRRQLNVKGFVNHDMYDFVDTWLESFKGKRFHGGSTPDIADVMLYGATVAYEGLDVWKELLTKTDIEPWLIRMRDEIGTSSCKMEMA